MNKKGQIGTGTIIIIVVIVGLILLAGTGTAKIIRTIGESPILWIFLFFGIMILLRKLKGE